MYSRAGLSWETGIALPMFNLSQLLYHFQVIKLNLLTEIKLPELIKNYIFFRLMRP